jgi:glycerol-3-phosphate dehydrogenase (NAD(P)+)
MQIGIIGAGSWGSTLARYLNEIGHQVTIWVFEPELYQELIKSGRNSLYFPELVLDKNVGVTKSLKEVIEGKHSVLYVTPSHVFRDIFEKSSQYLNKKQVLVSATKGIENDSLMTMSQIANTIVGERKVAVLSGPSFAQEVYKGHPTAVTIASENIETAHLLQNEFSSDRFRVYAHDDVIGTEIGGAVKNVIAIGVGISDGLGFGLNARAALITRALTEMIKLGMEIGAKPLTFSGLSGLGDLILTCTGSLSRNRNVGLKIGKGESIEKIQKEMVGTAEGILTTKSVKKLAEKYSIDMPITEQVFRVLYENKDPRTAVTDLMTRSLKREFAFNIDRKAAAAHLT